MMRPEPLFLALDEPAAPAGQLDIGPRAVVLTSLARDRAPALLAEMRRVTAQSPFRHMITQSGWRMSVANSNCGAAGWVSDRSGYRYDPIDPDTGQPWPAMPALFQALAVEAAEAFGFGGFRPDACLMNRYEPGARLSLHQDRNERDLDQPVVTVSLGLPAIFLWGGARREDPTSKIRLGHGDVMVWGGEDRLNFHGVRTLADGDHALAGRARYSLTFRKAL
jgi:alkylated DNA repair protein (DNA oxidative demethylase)